MAGATTFSAIFDEIFTGTGCNGQPACHATAAGGGLNLSSKEIAYTSLVNVAAMGVGPAGAAACTDSGLLRVVAGDPESSLLIQKLEHTQTCGGPMPSADQMLPPTQLQQLRSWIAQGALNN